MGTLSPVFDVQFVPRHLLAGLATAADPTGQLRSHAGSPFVEWLQGSASRGDSLAGHVAFTVVSRLDEPVVAIAVHTPKGALRSQPAVRAGTTTIAPKTIAKLPDGHSGYGWVDPTGTDRLVSVGSWLVSSTGVQDSGGDAHAVLHLRCATSKVDILVASISDVRPFGDAGGWNPYAIALHEPGDLSPQPAESDYDAFLAKAVQAASSADQSGTSATGAVSYLARSPQGFLMALQHVVVLLGPEPVTAGWDRAAPPEPLGVTSARAMASAPAPLDPVVPGVFYTIGSVANPSLVLDVDQVSTAEAATVQLYPHNGGANQQWRFIPVPGGGYTVVARHSGKCLDVFQASTAAQARVLQFTSTGGANQRWTRDAVAGSGFLLRAAHSGDVLEATGGAVAGAPIVQNAVNGGQNQLWVVTPVGP